MTRRYLLRRILIAVPVLLGTTLLIYAMAFALPGDPIRRLAGNHQISESTYRTVTQRYHLDQPFFVQYWEYIKGISHGDFGATFTGRDVSQIIAERFPVTLKLTLGAFAIEVVLGLIAAFIAALKRATFIDSFVLVSTLFLITIPTFVLAFLLQRVVGVKLKWLPVAGIQHGWAGYVMPCFALGVISAAAIGRIARSNLLDNINSEQIKAAIARGLPRRRVLGAHVLKNSLVPIITILGLDLAALMGGAPITETIFNLPGLGQMLIISVRQENGPLVVGLVTLAAMIFIFTNLVIDILCAAIDPRIRYG
jgi:ABC-type dipeptide/oligopeptide/nickel transport system permease component